MASSNQLEFEPLVNFDASTLTGTYQVINGAGTTNPLIAFKFYNSSSNLIILSIDGSTAHDIVPPKSLYIFDAEANEDADGGLSGHKKLAKGTLVYAKTSSDTDRLVMVGYI